ncbi:MAG: hypothetical protein K2H04_07450 [Bacteroidaceae bacterium]|nr:hypothetical protein [Bacteroidaceae bacterium]
MNNIDADSFAQKLKDYDEAFDFYMDYGKLPDKLPYGDLLGGFIGQTIQDNPQLESLDSLWTELLKEELMKFIEAMLQLFHPIEEYHRKEQAFIAVFASGSIAQKRKMWGQAVKIIESQYKSEEVNLKGYKDQLNESESEEQVETILNTMGKEWKQACDEKEVERKKKLIEDNQLRWERHIKEHGLSDYKERRKIERFFYSYPELKNLLRIIGREQPKREDKMDDTLKRYLPLQPSPPKPAAEAEEVANGNDLQHLLPSETVILSERQTEGLFYYKYATGQLQLFANRPKNESQIKTEQTQKKKPRIEKGPIIVAVDTSGSMSGRPMKIAYAVLLQLLRLARKQKRKVFLMSFSVRAKFLDLSIPRNWIQLNSFLEDRFSGGTDGEEMLTLSIKMLQSKAFEMADVLIISDFYFPLPKDCTWKKMQKEHNKGTRFYGLKIGCTDRLYDTILDKTWNIK